MNRGFYFITVLMLLVGVFCFTACGDGSFEENPTDAIANGGAIDEGLCKDACVSVGECIGTGEANNFVDACKQSCDQSGYFDSEALTCIETATCATIFDCGFEY